MSLNKISLVAQPQTTVLLSTFYQETENNFQGFRGRCRGGGAVAECSPTELRIWVPFPAKMKVFSASAPYICIFQQNSLFLHVATFFPFSLSLESVESVSFPSQIKWNQKPLVYFSLANPSKKLSGLLLRHLLPLQHRRRHHPRQLRSLRHPEHTTAADWNKTLQEGHGDLLPGREVPIIRAPHFRRGWEMWTSCSTN